METITIGKYTLESLTTGMYSDPKDFLREYIQNCADSIDDAVAQNILQQCAGTIDIIISENSIIIEDNGTGIGIKEAPKLLLDIGNSKKINTSNRGFRGIGRLAGLAYCDKLIFETSCKGESNKSTIIFDARKLRIGIYAEEGKDLSNIILESTEHIVDYEIKNKHYFRVILENTKDILNLSDSKILFDYLSQIAPLPFSPNFSWGNEIKQKLELLGFAPSEYRLFLTLNNIRQQLYKPYTNVIFVDRTKKIRDHINNIIVQTFMLDGDSKGFLWYADTDFNGTITNDNIRGIRLRKGNIQLGARDTLNKYYKEERFSGWLLGEMHLVSNNAIPNARRDDIEKNTLFYDFEKFFTSFTDQKISQIRKLSNQRSSINKEKALIENYNEESTDNFKHDLISSILNMNEQERIALSDNDQVAHSEIIKSIEELFDISKGITKYKSLNIQQKIAIDKKKTLEQVFDILLKEKKMKNADEIIDVILEGFVNLK